MEMNEVNAILRLERERDDARRERDEARAEAAHLRRVCEEWVKKDDDIEATLRAANAALKAEVMKLELGYIAERGYAHEGDKELVKLCARLERAEGELNEMKDYAGHLDSCQRHRSHTGNHGIACTCGWDAMREKWREGKQ